MTLACNAAPWPDSCLESLARVLESGDGDRMRSWMEHHISSDLTSWTYFAVAVASIGSDLMARAGERAGVDVYVPAADPSLPKAARDAELLTTMVLNKDWAGVNGLMAGLEERGELHDCCGALMATATVMLQFEATLGGRS